MSFNVVCILINDPDQLFTLKIKAASDKTQHTRQAFVGTVIMILRNNICNYLFLESRRRSPLAKRRRKSKYYKLQLNILEYDLVQSSLQRDNDTYSR